MSTRCPICGKGGLQATAVECPQCNADLEAFQLLEALQEVPTAPVAPPVVNEMQATEKVSVNVRPPAQTPIYLVAFAVIIGLFLGVGLVYFILQPNIAVPLTSALEPAALQQLQQLVKAQLDVARHLNEQLPTLAHKEDLAGLDKRLSLLEQNLRQLTERTVTPAPILAPTTAAKLEPATLTRRLTSKDTLWDIAKKHYGKGYFYPVLLALNPGLGIRFSSGDEIRLPTDRYAANQLFTKLVIKRNGSYLLRYPIVTGDTWQRISKRLNGNSKLAAKLKHLNGGISPVPGTSAFIPFKP